MEDRGELLPEADFRLAVDPPPRAAAVSHHAQVVFSRRGNLLAIATTTAMINAPT